MRKKNEELFTITASFWTKHSGQAWKEIITHKLATQFTIFICQFYLTDQLLTIKVMKCGVHEKSDRTFHFPISLSFYQINQKDWMKHEHGIEASAGRWPLSSDHRRWMVVGLYYKRKWKKKINRIIVKVKPALVNTTWPAIFTSQIATIGLHRCTAIFTRPIATIGLHRWTAIFISSIATIGLLNWFIKINQTIIYTLIHKK